MGGVGKTTVAKAFYNKYFYQFERSCFLENVREASQGYNGPLSLIEQLISELLEKQDFKVSNVERGVSFLKERVRTKKVLIVLDDLNQSSQLKLLIRYWNFFGPESRIIITTRDTRLLDEFEKLDEGYMVIPYMVKTLDKDESLELLSYHAFRGTISKDFREILERIVSYIGGLPLALEVLGSFLFRRTKEEWTSTLEKLQQIPNNQILTSLKISYDALDDKEKEIFLDIAFFLIGMDKEEANHIFDSSGFYPHIGIKVLKERCLLTIDRQNKFRMHDLIRDMGREIVREESIKEPGERSRLWYQEEVCNVLKKQKGTRKIEGIMLDITTSGQEYFDTKTFESMPNLRLLQINNVHLTGSFENSFEKLRWLCWRYCPLTCLPPSFHPPKLISLDMQYSNVITLWDGPKHLKSLKILNASHSQFLTTTPDFGEVKMLEKLFLRSCSSLVRIHPSVGVLGKLIHLDLSKCSNLKRLPEQFGSMEGLQILDASYTGIKQLPYSIGHMARLVKLNLFGCRSLISFPNNICNLSSLEELNLGDCFKLVGLPVELKNLKSLKRLVAKHTAIEQLPDSIGHLSRLVYLTLKSCNFRNLPNSICNLRSLESLILKKCFKLVGLPMELRNLKSLKWLEAKNTAVEQLPDSVGHLSRLVYLTLKSCKNLRNLPNTISNLRSLEQLNLRNCIKLVGLPVELGNMKSLWRLQASNTAIEQLPDSVGHLSRLVTLKLSSCKNLRNLPNSICNLRSLSALYLDGCFKLVGLPGELGNLKSLRRLVASNTAIEQLPDSVGHLRSLEYLGMGGCLNLKNLLEQLSSLCISGFIHRLPDSIGLLKNLRELTIEECNMRGGVLPDEIGSLSSLRYSSFVGESFCSLPASLSQLVNLSKLRLINCTSLQSLPTLALNLTYLSVWGCTSIKQLPNLSSLKYLESLFLKNCSSLESLPDLPPDLRNLYATGCISLKKLPNVAALKKLQTLDLTNCINLRITIEESFLQGLRDRVSYEITFPRGAILGWFSHQRTGSSVSFDMPPNLDNNFLGMVLWAVYSKGNGIFSSDSYTYVAKAVISNKTDGTRCHLQERFIGRYTETCELHSWVRYIGKPISMKSQDRIEVLFYGDVLFAGIDGNVYTTGRGKLKRCGVHLLHNNTVESREPIRLSISCCPIL